MKSSIYELCAITHLWVDDIQCWASTVKRWSNSSGKGLNCGDGSGSSTGLWWIRFMEVCSKIDDSVCMHSMALWMMSSFPHFLFPDPVCGRRQFRLSRASLMRHWRRRSRTFRLRTDSSERIWCGTYFLWRLGLWTLCRSSVDLKISTKEARMYTIFLCWMSRGGEMCINVEGGRPCEYPYWAVYIYTGRVGANILQEMYSFNQGVDKLMLW